MVTKVLERRIAELERKQAGSLRQRIVWWDEGKPKPQAEPGEQLTIISWMRSDEEQLQLPLAAQHEMP